METATLPLLDIKDTPLSVAPKTKAPKTAPLSAPVAPIVYRRDTLSREPFDNKFVTNERHFFGFRRRTPGPRTPSPSSVAGFVYDSYYDRHVRSFVAGDNLVLIGPPGSGKTQLATYLAYQMGLNYFPIALYAQTQGEDLLGKPAQDENGIWRYVPAPIVYAYIHGGLVCLDELLSLKPGVSMLLHPFLNRDPVIIQTDTGETTIYPHDDFRVFGTGNHWSRYKGNYEIGEALGDRATFVASRFLPSEIETAVLCETAPNVPAGVIGDLVKFANEVRTGVLVNPDSNRYCPSTRVLQKLVGKMELSGHTLDEAVEDCVIQKLRDLYRDEYGAIVAILKSHVALEDWSKYDTQVA